MSHLHLPIFSFDVDERWDPDYGDSFTVVLKFGVHEVARWPVDNPDSRWRYEDRSREEAAEEFVAARFAKLFEAGVPQ